MTEKAMPKQLGSSVRGICSETIVPVLIFVLAFVPRVLGLGIFYTVDEPFYFQCTLSFFRALRSLKWADTLGPPAAAGVPSVTTRWFALIGLGLGRIRNAVLHALGGLNDSTLNTHPRGLPALADARWPTVLLTAVAIAGVYVILRRTVGRTPALFAAVFLALDPFYMALSRIVGNDALHGTFALYSVLFFGLAFLRSDRRWIVASGISAGLGFLTKSPALVLLPLMPALAAMLNFALSERPQGLRWLSGSLLLWYTAMAATAFLLWPVMWVQPITTIKGILEFADNSMSAGNFFMGHFTPDPGPLYYPVAILFRLNPFVMIGLLGTIVALLGWLRSRPHRPALAHIWWLLLFAVLVVAYVWLLSLAPKKMDRYAMPVLLALDILGAIGLVNLLEKAAAMARLRPSLLFTGGWAVITAFGLYTVVGAYPYYASAYNPIMGGLKAAVGVEIVGWGEGLDQVAAYLNNKPNAESLHVGGYWLLGQPGYLRGRLHWVAHTSSSQDRPWAQLDYYVDYISLRQRGQAPPGFYEMMADTPPEYVVKIGGVPYAWVYRIPKERFLTLPADAVRVDAVYTNGLRLVGYRHSALTRAQDEHLRVPVAIYWQADASCDRHLNLELKLVNHAGTVWGAQRVEPPCGDPEGWRSDLIFPSTVFVEVLPGTPPGAYELEALMLDTRDGHEVRPVGREGVTLGTITLPRNAELRGDALDMEYAIGATLGNAVKLLGYRISGGTQAGEMLHFTIFWQCLRPLDRRYKVFVHVLDRNGQLLAGQDHDPVDGFYPTDGWEPGEIIRDQYRLFFEDGRAAGARALEVGLYDPGSGERLPVVLADGKRPADRSVRIGGR